MTDIRSIQADVILRRNPWTVPDVPVEYIFGRNYTKPPLVLISRPTFSSGVKELQLRGTKNVDRISIE